MPARPPRPRGWIRRQSSPHNRRVPEESPLNAHGSFGRFHTTVTLGEGRFGPVYLATDPETQAVVVVRAFTSEPLTDEQRHALVDALARLCDTPLDHASIARPIASGSQGGVPYLVHQFVSGEPVDAYLAAHGPRPLPDVVLRVTNAAAALDFAAAAGVYHGALGPRDVIFAAESTGVSGFGLVQALRAAGVPGNVPTPADDIYALAAMTFELLTGQRFAGDDVADALRRAGSHETASVALAEALDAALSTDPARWPTSALQFVRTLHAAQTTAPETVRPAPEPGNLFDAFAGEPVDAARHAPVSTATRPASRPDRHQAEPQGAGRLLFDAPLHETVRAEPDPEPPAAFQRVGEDFADLALSRVDHAAGGAADADTIVRPRRDPAPGLMLGSVAGGSRSGGAGWKVLAIAAAVALVVIASAVLVLRRLPALPVASVDSAQPAPETPPRTQVDNDAIAGQASRDADLQARAGRAPDAAPPVAAPPVAAPDPVTAAPASPGREPVDGRPPSASRPAAEARTRPEAQARTRPPVLRARAAAPPVAPEALMGRILVRSNPPGARVLVDGQPRGDTPVAIRGLDLGAHVVEVTAPGYPRWERRITLTDDRPSESFEIALGTDAGAPPGAAASPPPAGPGTLQVESRPAGAQVWVDGSLKGTTPLMLPEVAAGAHAVRIEMPGYRPWSTSVQVALGARARVAASLDQ